jgi:predicted tellurium resistance membrane protein TerC
MLELLQSPDAWIAFVTLSLMEVVLGLDNLVFIAILVGKVKDPGERDRLRTIGLVVALVARLGLLLGISVVMGLKQELFAVFGVGFSGRDLILLGGGLFLIVKATHEIYANVERVHEQEPTSSSLSSSSAASAQRQAAGILLQIVVIDLVFSLDSVITAIGMANQLPVMVAAMFVAVGTMLFFAKSIGAFVEEHPSVKILALSFLLLIGTLLVAEAVDQHVSKGTIYFAMAFSLGVELLNIRFRRKQA